MYVPAAREFPLAGTKLTPMLRGIARSVLAILCIAAVAVSIVAARYLIFELNHGDRHVVERLVNGGKS